MKLDKFSTGGWKIMNDGELEIGDVVITRHIHMKSTHIYQIDKVTKTMGTCDCGNFVQRFRRDIKSIRVLPAETWDTLDYRVFRKIEE